jgi:hypothetical protein
MTGACHITEDLDSVQDFFLTAHIELRLINQMEHQSGFRSANMMIENNRDGAFQGTMGAIAQFAIATTSDRRTVVMLTLTMTNSKITTQLESSQAYTNKIKEEIAHLNVKMKPAWQGQIPAKRAGVLDRSDFVHGDEFGWVRLQIRILGDTF